MRLTRKTPVYASGVDVEGNVLWKRVGVKRFYAFGVRIPAGLYSRLYLRLRKRLRMKGIS